MASPSSLSLLGFKQLSIYLVDCFKTPADLRPAARPEPEEKSQQEARHHLCEHCGKSFSKRSNVFRHQRRHCKAKRVCARLKLQSVVGQKPSSRNQMYRKQRCRAKSDVALCSDDDWVSKCPSGCRLKGLMSQMESEVERKLKKVCKKATMYKDTVEKSMMTMTDIYNKNRRDIVNRYMFELKFVENAEGLTKNFTALQNRSSKLSRQFDEVLLKAQKQMEDLYRTEVDIDMKLRACYGSCQSALPFSVDHPSYQMLQSDMDQMDKTLKRKAVTAPEDLPHIKLQHVDTGPPPSREYKTIPIVQRELLTQFEDIEQNQIVLEDLL